MNKEEAIRQFKSMFPEDIEAVVLTKESYDNYLGIKEYENIQLKQKIEELEEEIIDLRADYGTKTQIERDLAIDKIKELELYEKCFEIEQQRRKKLQERVDKAIKYIEEEKEEYEKGKLLYKEFGRELEQYAKGQLVACKHIEDILKGEE